MFYHNINPVLLQLGPLQIRYYSILFVLGFILTYFILIHFSKKGKLNLTKQKVADLIFYLILGVVIGARIFYVIFYNFQFYLSSPLEIFAVWHGGLSFHGGLIGVLITAYLFCKKHKVDFMHFLDLVTIPASLALFLGRIGNFLNAELVGRITTVPWAVKFPGVEGFRHPSQLYESAKNLIIFFTLWHLKDKKLKKGTLFFIFVVMYSFLRFFVEFFRAPDPQVGYLILGLTMGQILNIVMFIIGIVFIFMIYKKPQIKEV